MARGSIAKEKVIEIMKKAFGPDFITVDGSKIYVWAQDGAERVQIALAMTCPKTFVEDTRSNSANSLFCERKGRYSARTREYSRSVRASWPLMVKLDKK